MSRGAGHVDHGVDAPPVRPDVVIVHCSPSTIDVGIVPLSEVERTVDGRPICPRCGQHDQAEEGFGLAGGGFGPYLWCDRCGGVVAKTDDDEGGAR